MAINTTSALLLVLRLICVSRFRGRCSQARDGSDDDGGPVPTVYAALDPDDPEPVCAAGPAAGARRPSGRKVTLHPKCFSRLDKFAGGKEKWREWCTTFRMATATQNATVFEILNWIEENGEHTFGEIMETDPEGIQSGRFNGMATIDKEVFQHLVLSTEEEAKMVVKAVENADGFVACSRLHAKYSRRTVARIMRIHKECMYPSQVKDVKLLTSAFL